MLSIPVELGERGYVVRVGDGVRHELARVVAETCPRASVAALITSDDLRSLPWFDIATGLETHVISVPPGEAAKQFSVLERVVEELAALQLSRHDVIVAVGGGAVTDLAGFAAATYLRGVAVIHLPTTVVGQLDAAIGGKTAIDLRAGKNLMGAFHQPRAVLCDLTTLGTLPDAERRAGMGEAAKCWLLEGRDLAFFNDTSFEDLLVLSIRLKARIVSHDEREGGERALLNYGHTLAHALEKIDLARRTDGIRHGEAVGVGLAFAARVAVALGLTPGTTVSTTDAIVRGVGLDPSMPDGFAARDLLEAMRHDKKAHHNLTFVLPTVEGFKVVNDVSPTLVEETLLAFGAL
jgi:5-deoxy-5-amino-3-dehydroquinate synthase